MAVRYVFWLLAIMALQSPGWPWWDFWPQFLASLVFAMAFAGLTNLGRVPAARPSLSSFKASDKKWSLVWSWIRPY